MRNKYIAYQSEKGMESNQAIKQSSNAPQSGVSPMAESNQENNQLVPRLSLTQSKTNNNIATVR
ncbi:MAG: hypothetical protein ACD_62C00197G0002 [uncultured bacterium]|nr:MAG: hypothetical protein ACD_62C00197G0002 [uncultured bacterium]